jgi:5-formyltetrahydrofolate cyclo-ligase
VSGYWPVQDELDPRPLMLALAARGAQLALPVAEARGRPLRFRAWRPDDPLAPGALRIPEPLASAPEVLPDLVLVPMLAFDRRGFRLGYGAGFYDRTLALVRATKPVLAVGLAYAAQESDAVPVGTHDEPLDWVVTEAGATRLGGAP